MLCSDCLYHLPWNTVKRCSMLQENSDGECPVWKRDWTEDAIGYCEKWCGPLTHEQKVMIGRKVKTGEFFGVGRAAGSMQWCPLVEVGTTLNAVDGAGYYQLSSIDGRRMYDENVGVERNSK